MDVVEDKQRSQSNASMDIGALLIEARENKNLTAQNIADEMNLTLSIISKIEANEFRQDIPLAFIRGYVRSYAQKVGVDVETICVEFDRQTDGSIEPVQNLKVVSNFKTRRREINSSSFVFKLVTFLIIISLVAFAGWELWKKLSESEPGDAQISNAVSLDIDSPTSSSDTINTDATLSSDLTSNETVDSTTQQSTLPGVESQSPAATLDTTEEQELGDSAMVESSEQSASAESNENTTESATINKPLITGPTKQIEFTFSDDCWVQVTDGNGEVIAVGIKKQDYVMPLEGVAPFNVILGEPTAVNITVDGDAFDLSGYRAGRRAQFLIE